MSKERKSKIPLQVLKILDCLAVWTRGAVSWVGTNWKFIRGAAIFVATVLGLYFAYLSIPENDRPFTSSEPTYTPTKTASATSTPDPSDTPTVTWTPSRTPTDTPTATNSSPPTKTATYTLTPTHTLTATDIPTIRPTSPPLGYEPAARNDDWTPVVEEISDAEMVLVPVGCYTFSGSGDEQCFEEPFWIDRYEVTNERFGSLGCTSGNSYPRDCVTWIEARAFCERRNARLPTQTEWEYAAKGPDNLIYPWGNTFDGNSVVYDANSRDTFRQGSTASVGSRPSGASWVGGLDMSGNVWEWAIDTSNGESPILRGGSRDNDPEDLTTASTLKRIADFEADTIGFRCVSDVQP